MAPTVLVVGGAVAGLAAAERLQGFADVTLLERQSYSDKRVNCGEAINDASLVPLEKTPENGFHNDVSGFELRVYRDTTHPRGSPPLARARIECEPGYLCDRNLVERRWADRLESLGVTVSENTALSPQQYREATEEYDYVVDATGQPALAFRAFDIETPYTGDMVALNATVEGEFRDHVAYPRIFFEGYVGYAWSFPKSDTRANVGIGWAGDQRPDDYLGAFRAACERNGVPVPDREATNVYTIPRGPSLAPELAHPRPNVFLVGDAAGIANRYQGEGICQAIRSSVLLGDLIERGAEDTYPAALYESMRAEYRLAHLMRGAWIDHENPELLAALVRRLDGLTIDEITRHPRTVFRRILGSPGVAARLLASRNFRRRLADAYTDSWEYTRRRPSPDERQLSPVPDETTTS